MPYHRDSLEARILAGDPEVLGLVRRWIAETLTATRFWRLRGEWRDLQQEVLFRVIESLRRERFRSDGELKSYVQGICRHTALSRLSERAQKPQAGGQVNTTHLPSAGNLEQEIIAHQLVRRALDEASAECREMIRAYFLEEQSYAEVAARLGIPVGTVKSRLFRCLRCLQESMAPGARPAGRPAR